MTGSAAGLVMGATPAGSVPPLAHWVTVGRSRLRLGLDVDDAFATGEPVSVRAKPEDEGGTLRAAVADAVTGELRAQAPLRPDVDGWWSAQLGPFAEGSYRVTVWGDGAVEPVSDVFAVLHERPAR